MNFGQLIECNRNIFLEKSYTKCGRKPVRSFYEKIKVELISGLIV